MSVYLDLAWPQTKTGDEESPEIPYGFCHCGCGQKTTLAAKNDRYSGLIKGEPRRYRLGHAGKKCRRGGGPNPSGICQCGCGQKTERSTQAGVVNGVWPGEYLKFRPGHKPGFQHERSQITVRGEVLEVELFGYFGETRVALVDRSDISIVEGKRWRWVPGSKSGDCYAGIIHAKQPTEWMHHFIIGKPEPGFVVDHRNGNGLDNRRENLRFATPTQNVANRVVMSNSSQPFKGISRTDGRYAASICVNRKRISLGRFETAELAAQAYDNAAREIHGEFACVNFPRSGERSALTGEIAK